MRNNSPQDMQQDPLEGSVESKLIAACEADAVFNNEQKVDFAELSKRVFHPQDNGLVFIGGEILSDQQRALLKDQATNFLTTQLWEVISATLRNEAATLALKKSTTWDHVTFAKALDYVESTVEKMLITLSN